MYFHGIDPDLKFCTIARLDERQRLISIDYVTAKGADRRALILDMMRNICSPITRHFSWSAAAAVEGQNLTYTGKANKARAQDVADLANISGAVCACLMRDSPGARVYLPSPQDWKNSEPKHINQERTFQRLGIPFVKACVSVGGDGITKISDNAYCYPATPLFGLTNSQWKDAADAVGLALYAFDTFNKTK